MLTNVKGLQLVHGYGGICLLVCFIIKSFLTFIFFHLHLLYQPYLGLCQAQCVQSHQRQSMSAVAITACEVQVPAANSRTVPTVAVWSWLKYGQSKMFVCVLKTILSMWNLYLSLSWMTRSLNISKCMFLILLSINEANLYIEIHKLSSTLFTKFTDVDKDHGHFECRLH